MPIRPTPRSLLAVTACLMALGAVQVATLPAALAATTIAVEVAPAGPMPPPIVEERLAPPSPTMHWIPGHWVWRDVQWVWAKGHWHAGAVPAYPAPIVEKAPPPPGAAYVWIPGHWRWADVGWKWSAGHWVVRRG